MSSNVEKEAGSTEPVKDTNQPDAPEPEKKKREYKEFGHDEEKATRTCFLQHICVENLLTFAFQTRKWTCPR